MAKVRAAFVLAAAIVAGLLLSPPVRAVVIHGRNPFAAPPRPIRNFGMWEYDSLKEGMSRGQVFAALGTGKETASSGKVQVFIWSNPDGSNITATFIDGSLSGKAQAGL